MLLDTVTVRAGSDLVLDAAVGGRPDPKACWSKGTRDLELCEKYHLQYTPTKAMAIIKFCDRDDTGQYILTVRNVSGTRTAEVNVKVLGEWSSTLVFKRVTHSSCPLSCRYCWCLQHVTCPLICRYSWCLRRQHWDQQDHRRVMHFELEPSSGGWWRQCVSLHRGAPRHQPTQLGGDG